MQKQPLKNLIVLNLDGSGSMGHLKDGVIKLFNSQIEYLVKRSKELEQETRIFVYVFQDEASNLVWDVDCLRVPSIEKLYQIGGMTALVDATIKSIEDIKTIPQLYCDYSILHYTISDGMNNINAHRSSNLRTLIGKLPDNWTLAFLAPNMEAKQEAIHFGFPAQNIQQWEVSAEGIAEMSVKLSKVTDDYMVARATGVKGTKNLFSLNTDALKVKTVKSKLEELTPLEYDLVLVRKDSPIKEYLQAFLKRPYVIGSGYYPLTKREVIQSYKQICVMHKKNGKVYSGANARQMLGLPDFEVKVNPEDTKDFLIFVQSTSTNRKLIKGTNVLVLK